MLHVLTGPGCNNNCLFCMEADRTGRDASVRAQSAEDVRAMIAAYPECDEILFTSGEPTLNPELPRYAAWARDKGFRIIGLITNGRRLAYPPFLATLLQAGINRVTVSLHGHTAAVHDGLTRTPGSFEQTRAGLENLALARRTHPTLRIHTSSVVNRRNLRELAALWDYLGRGPADQIVFNVMMAKGRGALHFASLMPRYSEVVHELAALCPTIPQRTLLRTRVVDLPLCLLSALPPALCGELESFEQFEPIGSTGLTELSVLNACSEINVASRRAPEDGPGRSIAVEHLDADWADVRRPWWTPRWLARRKALASARQRHPEQVQRLRDRITSPHAGHDRKYYVTRRHWKDDWLRTKGPGCPRCALEPSCPGVWTGYVDVHGWSEFLPIEPPPTGVLV